MLPFAGHLNPASLVIPPRYHLWIQNSHPLTSTPHLFTYQSPATERMTVYLQNIQVEIYGQKEKGSKN